MNMQAYARKRPLFCGARHVAGMLLALALHCICQCAWAQVPTNPQSYSRQNGYEVDMAARGQITAEVIEPNNGVSCVRSDYGFDAWGNRTSVTTSNCSGAPASAAFATRTVGTAYALPAMPSVLIGSEPIALVRGTFPLQTTNALSQTQSHTFDPRFGVPLSQTDDQNGLTTRWSTDDFGRITRQTNPDGTSAVSFYCTLSGIGLDTSSNTPGCPTPQPGEAPSDAIEFVHAEPRNTSDAKMGSFTRSYRDRLGRTLRVVTESFDGASQPVNGLIVADTRYNTWGAKLTESHPYFLSSGSTTTAGNNDRGVRTYVYDVQGRVTDTYITDQQGNQASISFPGFGSMRAARTRVQWSGLNATTTDDLGHTRLEERNVLGRVVRVTDAQAAQVALEYDAFGNLITIRDALQNVVKMDFDIRGHRVSLIDPDAGTWGYCYDAAGQLKAQQNASMRGSATVAACPSSTGTALTASSTGGWTTYAYDLLGRTTQRIEPEGTSTWSFDKYADNGACNKGVGKLCQVANANGVSRRYAYDAYGRPSATRTDVLNGPSFATTLAYDGSTGRLSTHTYPSGAGVSYSYTARGYLEKLGLDVAATIAPLPATPGGAAANSKTLAAGTALWQVQAMNALGDSERELSANGVVTLRIFDPARARPTTITAGIGGATNVLSQSYSWDSVRNLRARADANGDGSTGAVSETFAYDGIDRLSQYTVAASQIPGLARSVTLEYNAIGNLLLKSDSAVYTYNPSGQGSVRPHAVASVSGSSASAFGYDANGNLISSSGGKYTGLTYTSFNLPDSNTGAVGPSGTPRYVWWYDENHARIKEQRTISSGTMAGTRTTWYLHPDNSGGLAFESEIDSPSTASAANPAGTGNRHYLTAGGQTIGVLITTGSLPTLASGAMAPPALSNISAVKLEFWHKDYQGSISATTDHWGSVTARYAYDPFGKRRYTNGQYDPFGTLVVDWSSATNNGTDRGYTGHEHLDDIGLIHMNGRIYDPNLGRMLQADPVIQAPENLQSTNRYTYAFDNPFRWTDPTGWMSDAPCEAGTGMCESLMQVSQRASTAAPRATDDTPKTANGGLAGTYDLTTRIAGNVWAHMKAELGEFKNNLTRSGELTRNDVAGFGAGLLNEAYGLASIGNPLLAARSRGDLIEISQDQKRGAAAATVFTMVATGGEALAESIAAKIGSRVGPLVGREAAQAAKEVMSLNPASIRFSQSSVNGVEEIVASMRASGWKGAPIDVVRMSDGTLITFDNTRLLAAHRAGINVQAVVRDAAEAFPAGRWTPRNGVLPATWEDAIRARIQQQSSRFRTTYPDGSSYTGSTQ